MGGLDGLIFTAGIGENSPEIRELVTQRIAYLGIDLDQKLNQVRGKPVIISQPASKVEVMTIPTNEELMIARDVEELIKESSVKKAANF
jgi:acetate kinase